MSKYIESNMDLIRNDKNITVIILGKKTYPDRDPNPQISNLYAFDLSGQEVSLSLSETHRAENLLLKEKE